MSVGWVLLAAQVGCIAWVIWGCWPRDEARRMKRRIELLERSAGGR